MPNSRIFLVFTLGALQLFSQQIVVVAGGNGRGSALNQLANPVSIYFDADNSLYVSDLGNSRVQKFVPGASQGVTIAGGHGAGAAANQLSLNVGITVDDGKNVYIADQVNGRIQKWAPGATSGVTVAGGNGQGYADNQLFAPDRILIDMSGNLIITDNIKRSVIKWAPGASSGVTLISNLLVTGMALDAANNLYLLDFVGVQVLKFAPGSTTGVIVAGDNGTGTAANQFWNPIGLFVDPAGNIYVGDRQNYRVQKWTPGAREGITVAGGNGRGNALNQFEWIYDVFVDKNNNLFVADQDNNRIMEYKATDQNKGALQYKYYEGVFNSLPDFSTLSPVKTGTTSNADISIRPQGVNDNFAFLWEGYINLPSAGTYTFETISDDGSKLYFNSMYSTSATALIDNNGLHAPQSVSNTITVSAPGRYPIAMCFFEKDGGESMQVFYSGPGIPRQQIPDAAFVESNAQPGNITYKYYEGVWNSLPDFNTLAPVLTGNSQNIDINVRPFNKNDGFAFVWEGYLNIPTAGTYTFETNSDDGSRFYFNSLFSPSALPTINNDGLHAPVAVSTTVNVPAPGIYPVAFTYFEKDGGELMNVSWSGPSFSKQLIPTSAFVPKPANPAAGLAYKYYEGTWDVLPDFNSLTPIKTGISANADISVRPSDRNDNFGFLWQGFINIPSPGMYTFETISDDGSKVYFNTPYTASATPTVSNDGLHAPFSTTGTVNVAASGWYPITITFFQKDGGQQMELYWSGPGIQKQRIPDAAFAQVAPSATLNSSPQLGNVDMATTRIVVNASVYPNPFRENFNITFYNTSATNNVQIGIYDPKGQLVYRQDAGNVAAGNITLQVKPNRKLMPGEIYVAMLQINGVPLKVVKIVKLK